MKLQKLILISALFFVLSCTEDGFVPEYTDIPIGFSSGIEVASRGQSLENLEDRYFGVRGYIYDTRWDSEEALAKPDPAWLNTEVHCSNLGECAYDPVQRWQFNKNYAFFAYCPFTARSQGTVTLSPETEMKAPVMTYSMHKSALTDTSKMYDVMYAYKIDANVTDNPTVNFHFRHCLSAIQPVVENLNEEPVQVSDLELKMFIQYKSVDIPLNGNPVTPHEYTQKPAKKTNARYIYVSGDHPVTVPSTLNKPYVDISRGNHILFIPQKGTTMQLRYRKKPTDAYSVVNREFRDKDFLAGRRYIISLQFVGQTVNVLLIDPEGWVDKNNDVEFE